MKVLDPIRWFPLDHSLIPTLADLGRKRMRYVGPFERQPDGRYSVHLTWDGKLTQKQHLLTVVSNKMPHHYRTAIPRLYRPQQVQLFRPRYEADDSAGDGTSKRPHWRRMHWRHIPCGKGKAQRKLALIESTFVNKDRFVGDLSTTIYTAV